MLDDIQFIEDANTLAEQHSKLVKFTEELYEVANEASELLPLLRARIDALEDAAINGFPKCDKCPAELSEFADKLRPFVIQAPLGDSIYFLFSFGQLVYIGTSARLMMRMGQHQSTGKMFDSVFYFPVPKEDAYRIEAELIARFRPPLNSK